MSSFVLGEDAEGEDQLSALMDASSTSVDIHRQTTNDAAEKEAEAALDSILETSVAEVNLALSHDDAVAAAVNAAALDATSASSVVVDEAAVTAAAEVAASDPSEVMKVVTDTQDTTVPFEDQPTVSTAINGDVNASVNVAKPATQPPSRAGRWSLDEKILFLFGLQKFGKGHWKKISMYVPDRSLVQIKSHAQKVLKRINSGENVFRRLEENVSRLHVLVKQIHEQLNLEPPKVLLQPATLLSVGVTSSITNVPAASIPTEKRKQPVETTDDDDEATKRPRNNKPSKNGTEHIAASALCQLAGPDDEDNENQNGNEIGDTIVAGGDAVIKTEDDIELGELISI